MTTTPVILLELNEINFEFVAEYSARGELPHLTQFLARHGLRRTLAERSFEQLEPWIQWVTVHTGLDYARHRVFRLGDIVETELPQIWEILESRGFRVGAISPMNARNASRHPSFFVPDPWTQTPVAGSWDLKLLSRAVAVLVNDNSQQRVQPAALLSLLIGMLPNLRARSVPEYIRIVRRIARDRWSRALLLDRVLADTFLRQWRRERPDFSTLFLNAGAHVQHHYMYASPCYRGEHRNPPGYLPEGADPILDAYRVYDRVLADVQRDAAGARIMIATGLSQTPNPRIIRYYRPRDHKALLTRLGVPFTEVTPRMSRDFLVECDDASLAARAEALLRSVRAPGGQPIFSVDNRGSSLFCMVCYTEEIPRDLEVRFEGGSIERFGDEVTLVTIENAIHKTIGYFVDSGLSAGHGDTDIPLRDVFSRVLGCFDRAAPRDAA